jgi:hypothetical protein
MRLTPKIPTQLVSFRGVPKELVKLYKLYSTHTGEPLQEVYVAALMAYPRQGMRPKKGFVEFAKTTWEQCQADGIIKKKGV